MTTEKLKGLKQLNELALTDAEQEAMLKIFDTMNKNEEVLASLDTENTDIMVHVMPLTNILRDDVRSQPFSRESLLESAPERSEDSWQVPRLVK